jgi:secreted trypsin-like serine protease
MIVTVWRTVLSGARDRIVAEWLPVGSGSAASGGTCFGDSGGPNFLGSSNVLAGVTSYGLNSTCGGTGVYRVDKADDLTWLATFGVKP